MIVLKARQFFECLSLNISREFPTYLKDTLLLVISSQIVANNWRVIFRCFSVDSFQRLLSGFVISLHLLATPLVHVVERFPDLGSGIIMQGEPAYRENSQDQQSGQIPITPFSTYLLRLWQASPATDQAASLRWTFSLLQDHRR